MSICSSTLTVHLLLSLERGSSRQIASQSGRASTRAQGLEQCEQSAASAFRLREARSTPSVNWGCGQCLKGLAHSPSGHGANGSISYETGWRGC